MIHRLPLIGTPPARGQPAPLPRPPLPAAIGLADTSDGEHAADFAIALATALTQRGTQPHLVFVAYDHVPSLGQALAARVAAGSVPFSCQAVAREGARSLLRVAPLTLLVGLPALAAFAPALTILVGAERARASWPEPLRTIGRPFQLELCALRPGLPAALAASLIESRFLPHG